MTVAFLWGFTTPWRCLANIHCCAIKFWHTYVCRFLLWPYISHQLVSFYSSVTLNINRAVRKALAKALLMDVWLW